MPLERNCYLCDKSLKYNSTNQEAQKEDLPLTDDTHDPAAKSEAHYGHIGGKRSRKEFAKLSSGAWQKMGVKNPSGSVILCYECHEVVLHNPVFSESQLEMLKKLFSGKSFEDRVIVLNRIIEEGLRVLNNQYNQ
ncbi:MAG: hypothetical protein N2039_09910 [Gemmataceae bacterium]|nr:hypothetical protein [Gemmataceae bacterium]